MRNLLYDWFSFAFLGGSIGHYGKSVLPFHIGPLLRPFIQRLGSVSFSYFFFLSEMPNEDALRIASLHNLLEATFHKMTTLEKVSFFFT